MSDEDQDQDSKTEDATPRRVEDAIEKGQVINSKEVSNFAILACLACIISWVLPYLSKQSMLNLADFIVNAHDITVDQKATGLIFQNLIFFNFKLLSSIFIMLIVAAILASFIQMGRFNVSLEPLMPSLSKISPLSGLKKMFSLKSVMEFLKGIVKITIIGLILFFIIWNDLNELPGLMNLSLQAFLNFIHDIANDIMIGVMVAMAFIAALDYMYQRYEFYKNLMMTKQEIKEEHKQTEGSPEIKQKLRSIRMEKAKNRMMAQVPDADVIITNPTHFSIALKYDMETMPAPLLIAKGQDTLALKIREIANDNDIPLVENPPLARILYANVEVDDPIPVEHYEAVAAVISYVYKIKKKKIN